MGDLYCDQADLASLPDDDEIFQLAERVLQLVQHHEGDPLWQGTINAALNLDKELKEVSNAVVGVLLEDNIPLVQLPSIPDNYKRLSLPSCLTLYLIQQKNKDQTYQNNLQEWSFKTKVEYKFVIIGELDGVAQIECVDSKSTPDQLIDRYESIRPVANRPFLIKFLRSKERCCLRFSMIGKYATYSTQISVFIKSSSTFKREKNKIV